MKLNLAILSFIIALALSLVALNYVGKPVKMECGIILKGMPGTYCVKHDVRGNYYETEGKGQVYKIYVGRVRK